MRGQSRSLAVTSNGGQIPRELKGVVQKSDRLRGIFLAAGIPLEDPPLEIASKGREAVITYFRDREHGFLPLNELKIILVGHGSCGKTSLVKRVFNETFDPHESQTHGINIRSQVLQTTKGSSIKANFWDFGGQEIMHATHQLFLSKRSLYILVLDGRKEEDAEYWLQHIQSFGGDSPIMVVLNKIDEHPAFDVNRRFLISKYPSIIDFYRLSCANNTGIPEFAASICDHLDAISILQTRWPPSWFQVKQRLEEVEEAVISVGEYSSICSRFGVTDHSSQETLVDFLHDLGVILHYRDLPLLDTHVLDPRWVTEAVYRIINSKALAQQKGVLRLEQLPSVLSANAGGQFSYTPDKYDYIIELMLKFELCYRLDDNAILVPDLLDIQEPESELRHDAALRFVFHYQYLPKSIMPRFMVRMNRDISGGATWRTGVELRDKGFNTQAIVKADEKAKTITVAVTGDQKRDYLSVIRKVIRDINLSFEKLEVTELVPLPDAPLVMLDYNELIGYELAGRDEYFVGRIRQGYNVQTLLNGIEDRGMRVGYRPQTMINVQGDFFASAASGAGAQVLVDSKGGDKVKEYQPHLVEKVLTYFAGFGFLGVVCFLLVRNQPLADKNLVVFVRILLSLVVAVFGATLPGLLKIDLTSKKGIAIRSTGALALFVLAFLFTPKVL